MIVASHIYDLTASNGPTGFIMHQRLLSTAGFPETRVLVIRSLSVLPRSTHTTIQLLYLLVDG